MRCCLGVESLGGTKFWHFLCLAPFITSLLQVQLLAYSVSRAGLGSEEPSRESRARDVTRMEREKCGSKC